MDQYGAEHQGLWHCELQGEGDESELQRRDGRWHVGSDEARGDADKRKRREAV